MKVPHIVPQIVPQVASSQRSSVLKDQLMTTCPRMICSPRREGLTLT